MALDLGTITNFYYVNHGTMSSWDPRGAGAIAAWFKTTSSLQDGMRILTKGISGADVSPLNVAGSSYPANLSLYLQGQNWPNRLHAVSNGSEITASGEHFIASRWNTAGVDADQQLFYGNRSTAVAEVSGYSDQQVGSGHKDATGNSFVAGGMPGESWSWAEGSISAYAVWDSYATLDDLLRFQYYPELKPTGSNLLIWIHVGIHGTSGVGTQYDWSGNGFNGTVSGASKTDHIPGVKIFPMYPTHFYVTPVGVVVPRQFTLMGVGT